MQTTLLVVAAAHQMLAGVVCGVAVVLRPRDREPHVAGLFCIAAATHAIASAVAAREGDGVGTLHGAEIVAGIALLVAVVLAVQFAFIFIPRKLPRVQLLALYGGFACGMGVSLAASVALRSQWENAVVLVYAGVAVAFAVALHAWAYVRGRRDAVLVAVGGVLLLATMGNDAAVALGRVRTPPLAAAGLLAYLLAMGLARNVRFAWTRNELEQRQVELERLMGETVRIHEELAATREELLKKEHLAVVGELAAVIAHEVRNPLAIIANAVSGLRKEAISRGDHETLLAILDEEASRLNRLVTDLLRYARPVSVQRTSFLLSDLLERTVGHVRASGRGIDAALIVECKEERIWGDANLLRQVFDNLVDNAVQAMGAGGSLTVRVRATTEEGVDGLAVDIIDTGEGMDTHVRSRARDPFFTTRPSGTGLGLAIVDRIVEAHNGQFSIDSHTGEGTTVTVFLPLGSPSEPPAPKLAASPGRARHAWSES